MNKKFLVSNIVSVIALIISVCTLLKILPIYREYKAPKEHTVINTDGNDMSKTEIETLVKDNLEMIKASVKDEKYSDLLKMEGIESIIISDDSIAFYCGKTTVGNKAGFHGFGYNLNYSATLDNEDEPKIKISKTDGEKELIGGELTVNGKTHQMETLYRSEDIVENIFYFETQIYGF